jgi:putative flippase GtrA
LARNADPLIELSRFAAVGAVGFAIDGGILTLLMQRAFAPFEARLVSFSIAVTATWALNRIWTFSRNRRAQKGHEYLAYVITQVIGAALNLAVFFAILDTYPALRDYPLVPLAAGAIVGLVFNFTVAKMWVYRRGDRPAARHVQ